MRRTETHSEIITIRLTPTQVQSVVRQAEAEDRSMVSVIRRAIDRYVAAMATQQQ